MALIIGLGNVGSEYDGTRHNIGFEVVDRLAGQLSIPFEDGKGPFYWGEGSFKGQKITLIKPTTYMNRSGKAVTKAMALSGTAPEECLVCYDDINLPPGKLRMRSSGSAGGHNGLQNIIESLSTDQFPRLRIGIGNDFGRGQQSDYVLSPFTAEERIIMNETIDVACDAILAFLRGGINLAMNKFN